MANLNPVKRFDPKIPDWLDKRLEELKSSIKIVEEKVAQETKENKAVIEADSIIYRRQFDDTLAGGVIKFRGKTIGWSAIDVGKGYGWDIDIEEEKLVETFDQEEQEGNLINNFIERAEEAVSKVLTEEKIGATLEFEAF